MSRFWKCYCQCRSLVCPPRDEHNYSRCVLGNAQYVKECGKRKVHLQNVLHLPPTTAKQILEGVMFFRETLLISIRLCLNAYFPALISRGHPGYPGTSTWLEWLRLHYRGILCDKRGTKLFANLKGMLQNKFLIGICRLIKGVFDFDQSCLCSTILPVEILD